MLVKLRLEGALRMILDREKKRQPLRSEHCGLGITRPRSLGLISRIRDDGSRDHSLQEARGLWHEWGVDGVAFFLHHHHGNTPSSLEHFAQTCWGLLDKLYCIYIQPFKLLSRRDNLIQPPQQIPELRRRRRVHHAFIQVPLDVFLYIHNLAQLLRALLKQAC
jgi:hypothetical protein